MIEKVMPLIVCELESKYPENFINTEYSLYAHKARGLVGLNLRSDTLPSTLFWIDERLDVRACFGSLGRDESYRLFNKNFQKVLSNKLKSL